MKKKLQLNVTRNYNYTVSIVDPHGRELVFRDIRGSDLEFLDQVLKYDPEQDDKEGTKLSFDDVCIILNKFLVRPSGFDVNKLTKSTVNELFVIVKDNILCNYIPKVNWLKCCYGIQNSSFANLEQMESVPMSKFVVMAEIHREAIDQATKPEIPTDLGGVSGD